MSLFITYMFSYDRQVSKNDFKRIVEAALRVDCFVSFVGMGQVDDVRQQLISNFHPAADKDRSIIVSLSSCAYAENADDLIEETMHDPDGFVDLGLAHRLGHKLELFASTIECRSYIIVIADGYDIKENFIHLRSKTTEIADHLTAVLIAQNELFPSILIEGDM